MMATKRTERLQERANARRGPAWTWGDALLVAVMGAVILLAAFAPAVLADLGDTVVGSLAIEPSLNTSWSGLLMVAGRWIPVLIIAYAVWYVREAPWQTRAAWVLLAGGLLMNFARNVYTGNPATLSFLLAEGAAIVLTWRLCTRPTVWDTLAEYRNRAEAAEARAQKAEAALERWQA
jgi:hypothetical protein